MTKRVIFHIGTPKTGSTALQVFLANQREKLMENDVAYHKLPNTQSTCHWWFSNSFYEALDKYTPAKNEVKRGGTYQELIARGNTSKEQAISEISNHSTLILSAEQFFFLPQGILTRINDFFSHLNANVSIVAYVRNPLDAARSDINQKVKMGFGTLDEYSRDPPTFPIQKALENFSSVFGNQSINVRTYERESLIDGDIRRDFVSNFLGNPDLDFSENSSAESNTSLSHEALIMIDQFNKKNPSVYAHSERRDKLLDLLSNVTGRKFKLSEHTQKLVLDKCATDLEYLEKTWKIKFKEKVDKHHSSPSEDDLEGTIRSAMDVFSKYL